MIEGQIETITGDEMIRQPNQSISGIDGRPLCQTCGGDGMADYLDNTKCPECHGIGKAPESERGKHTCWVDRCCDCNDQGCDARAEAYIPPSPLGTNNSGAPCPPYKQPTIKRSLTVQQPSDGGAFERVVKSAALECRDLLMANNGGLPTHLWMMQEKAVYDFQNTIFLAHNADRAADKAMIALLGGELRNVPDMLREMKGLRQRIAELEAQVDSLQRALISEYQSHGNDLGVYNLKKARGEA